MPNNNQSLAGKVAVITGAASGIGRGLARHAASQGMQLVLADVNVPALEAAAAELAGVEVLTQVVDVSDAAAVDHLAGESYRAFGCVDLLFNNAGIMATGLSWEISPEVFQRTLAVNFNGVVNGVRAFLPRMNAQGRPGHIVNTASMGGLVSSPIMAPYAASKFAVVAFSESLRDEVRMLELPLGVSVLCPGPVLSDILDETQGGSEQHPRVQRFVQKLRQKQQQNGISPEELARRAFRDIEAGKFWLLPQPESVREGVERRCAEILAHCRGEAD